RRLLPCREILASTFWFRGVEGGTEDCRAGTRRSRHVRDKDLEMEPTTYTALCERAGRWWTIRVPQVEGLTAQVRSLEQAEVMTRKVIARHLGIPAEAIKVD